MTPDHSAPSRPPTASLGKRLVWLAVCVAAGAGIGAAGHWLSGDTAWYLALPAAVAVGWWFLADPSRCTPPPGESTY